MLGKLMKYEWKATWKLLLPVNAFIAVIAFFAYLSIRVQSGQDSSGLVFTSGALILMGYGLGMLVVSIGTVVFLIYRFYTSVYGDQGYLLHTLPVDKHQIIMAKMFVSTGWVLLSSLIIIASVVVLFSFDDPFFQSLAHSVMSYFELFGGSELTDGFTAVMTILAAFIMMTARVLKVMACISLGQMSQNHKVMAAFAFYFGIYMAQKIAFLTYGVLAQELVEKMMQNGGSFLGRTWETTMISGIFYGVIFYVLTWYMMEKKLNLD